MTMTYTFWVDARSGAPLELRMLGANLIGGSHKDEYVARYTNYTVSSARSSAWGQGHGHAVPGKGRLGTCWARAARHPGAAPPSGSAQQGGTAERPIHVRRVALQRPLCLRCLAALAPCPAASARGAVPSPPAPLQVGPIPDSEFSAPDLHCLASVAAVAPPGSEPELRLSASFRSHAPPVHFGDSAFDAFVHRHGRRHATPHHYEARRQVGTHNALRAASTASERRTPGWLASWKNTTTPLAASDRCRTAVGLRAPPPPPQPCRQTSW
jgi:hypothetical protein